MNLHDQKTTMRSRIKGHLDLMSEQEHSRASQDLCVRIAEATQEVNGYIFAFIPMAGEVDITPFLRKRLPGNVAIPLVDWNTRTMEPCRLHGLNDAELAKDRHGLRTPNRIERIDRDEIESIIVPALAFDENGFRLGRGGGYYDRFLEAMTPEVPRIGVAFDRQIVKKVPVEPWDKKVDIVITPTRTISIRQGES